MTSSKTLATYEQMGIAALLPGMQHMVTLMQAQLDEMRARLETLQSGEAPAASRPLKQKKHVGRPPGRKSANGLNGWPADPEARKAEMRRRIAVRQAKRGEKIEHFPMHISDERHPGHNEWLAKLSRTRKRNWRKMTPEQQQAHLAKMAAGRNKPRVDMVPAA